MLRNIASAGIKEDRAGHPDVVQGRGANDKEENTMGTMIFRHQVRDYDIWRGAYDGHESERVAAGLTDGRVFRAADNPNDIVVLLDMADVDQAKAFSESSDLATAMEGAGVMGPPALYYVE